jgi:hypothetical protein
MKNVNQLRRLKKRIGANGPGITIAVAAMIIALTGVAFAAGGALTGPQKKEVKALIKKEAKKLRGPRGPAGNPGSQGAPGAKGDPGGAGAPGKNGASVIVTPLASGDPECNELGGSLVEKEGSGNPAQVCNGERGEPGDPWTAGGTLPANGMLTGTWVISGNGIAEAPISFPIQLAENAPASNVFYGEGEESAEPTEFQKHCENTALKPGVVAGNPKTLCIYVLPGSSSPATFERFSRTGSELSSGIGKTGGFLVLNLPSPGVVHGTYAVSGG